MTRSIILAPAERRELLDIYRKHADSEVRFRAHILLLLDDGRSWQDVGSVLYCSSRTIDRWVKRFQDDGLAGLGGRKRGRPFRFSVAWARIVVAMVLHLNPRQFGSLRSRWTCGAVGLALDLRFGFRVSRETVRRWLRGNDMVYRRPRPVLGPHDPHREAKLAALRQLLARLPADETVVWQDEVDVNDFVRVFGDGFSLSELSHAGLQKYVNRRSSDGVSPTTIRTELRTLRAAWNWGRRTELVTGEWMGTGLVFKKIAGKPFQTRAEIERQIAAGALAGVLKDHLQHRTDGSYLFCHTGPGATNPGIHHEPPTIGRRGVRRPWKSTSDLHTIFS